MAYRDPYTERHVRYDQPYTDAPDFNPYNNEHPHEAYDQSGYDAYREDANFGQSTNPGESTFAPGHHKSESSQYDQGAFARATNGSRPTGLSHWRHERHGGMWTKGGRGACIGRFCCCTLMIIVFFIISILLPLALWTRPPNIIVGSVQAPPNGSEIQLLSNGVQLNLEIPIYVSNPNYFSVSFSSIKANIYYPIGNTHIGQGQENDITFHSHSSTNFTFPFSMQYTTAMSSSTQIFADLATKCGIGGGTPSAITVNYDITLDLRILFFTVSPKISNSDSFQCPLTASDLKGLIPALSGL